MSTPTPRTAETTDRRTIGGIEFEAVRMDRPILHWRARIVSTGHLYEAGVFKSESRPRLWASIEDTARRVGELWKLQCELAHQPPQVYLAALKERKAVANA